MTEEQDPPSFKAARRKDREMLAELEQDENLEKVLTIKLGRKNFSSGISDTLPKIEKRV